jgi:hypothetical protein
MVREIGEKGKTRSVWDAIIYNDLPFLPEKPP